MRFFEEKTPVIYAKISSPQVILNGFLLVIVSVMNSYE